MHVTPLYAQVKRGRANLRVLAWAYRHIRHVRTDSAGLSSAGAHEFTFSKAGDARCPYVIWQRVERAGWVESRV